MGISKKDLTKKVAARIGTFGATLGEIEKAAGYVDAIFEVIKSELAEGREITIIGFGTSKVTKRKERKGRNPQTGEEIIIPAHKLPILKVSESFKNQVN